VKLNWSWNEADIPWNACDADNEDYIYCDATQFSIELSKKIHMIEEFYKGNDYAFECPDNYVLAEAIEQMEEFNRDSNSHTVDSNSVGVAGISAAVQNDTAVVMATVKNNTFSGQTLSIGIGIRGGAGNTYSKECTETVTVAAGQNGTVQCVFGELPEHHFPYTTTAVATSGALANTDYGYASTMFLNQAEEESDECWLPAGTGFVGAHHSFEYFIDSSLPKYGRYVNQESVVWTQQVQNVEQLKELVKFKAYLVKDGYSNDFRQDFAEFYVQNDFFNAPYWFADDPAGKLADFFARDENGLEFMRQYVPGSELPSPGLYDVEIDIRYAENRPWKLFDADGHPSAVVIVKFYKLDDPYPDSVFYYLPFNGNLGIDSDNGRQGYGTNYFNETEDIVVTSESGMVKTANIPGAVGDTIVNTKTEYSFRKINKDFSNRGLLMKISETDDTYIKKMLFTPNYATPVIMKMVHDESEEPFQAFYQLLEAGTPLDTGASLSFWDGAGQCLDYTGVPVFEAFDFTPDREGMQGDPIPDWEFLYAVEWDNASYAGDVYLKTVFYSPVNAQYSIRASAPEGMGFVTPNAPLSASADLQGIQGMPHNSIVNQEKVTELQELFDLVKTGHVCVTNSGIETSFWWNPKVLYETAGANTSIRDLEIGLVAGQNCIGYEGQ